ncbi:hypothetical protein [Plantactinospora sp. WMMB782]|uniref:hypothetical protein n=1 Tax=Plantactinospora sp. WMMB782 TaxID=3404121 RepID=UPI003B9649B9
MARLQVLYLPDRQFGPEEFERRFALVLDELDGPLSGDERVELDAFVQEIGAAGVYGTTRTIDCAQGDDGEVEEIAARLRELVDERIGETVQATLAQQKPPAEPKPKVTRTWGTVDRDPRESIPGWTPEAVNG